MIFESLGGINEHGRNCFLIKSENHQILLDCGLSEEGNLPDFSKIDATKIDALFVSHSHLDHTGALKEFVKLGFKGKIYLSKPTFECLSFKGFDYEFLSFEEDKIIFPWLKVKSFRSGHCFGSFSFLIEMEDKKILYTGDYLENSIFICDVLRNIKADLAIIDAAYNDDELDIVENKKEFLKLLNQEKKILLPLPKNGRSMEVISLLNDNDLKYQILSNEFFVSEDEKYLRHKVNINNDDDSTILLFDDPQITKEDSLQIITSHIDYSLIFTGTIDEGSMAMNLMNNRKNTFFQRINVHQRIKDAKKLIKENHFKKVILFHNSYTKEKNKVVF